MKKIAFILFVLAGLGAFVWLRQDAQTPYRAFSVPESRSTPSWPAKTGEAGPTPETAGTSAPSAIAVSNQAVVTSGEAPELTGRVNPSALPENNNGVTASTSQRMDLPAKPNEKTSKNGKGDFYRSVSGILHNVDLTDEAVRARVVAELAAAEEARYAAVLVQAAQRGIPLQKAFSRDRTGYLHDFRDDDSPIYRLRANSTAAISSGANLLYPSPYNLSGAGIKVGVWDEGSVRSTHRELTGRVTLNNSSAAINDHATHVAGTIAATGVTASARGMARGARIESYDWNSDTTEMTAAGAVSASDTNRVPISNHSYGYAAVTDDMGRYNPSAVNVDSVANNLPFYLPFWAAGNEQADLPAKGGYQSITFVGLAKNVITVGAVNDAVSGGVRSPANGTMSDFSSWGPCDDGRIKPDVVANGVGVNSSIGTGDSAYASYNGTSMATPSAAGSAALIAELYAREFSNQRMLASMLKGLLIHTADDLGRAGPDYQYGWGLINVKKVADLVLAHKATPTSPRMITNSVSSTVASRTHTFIWDGISPIRATLVWTDPAGTAQTASDSRTPNLRNNLDLRVLSPNGATNFPYVMPYVGNWTDAVMTNLAIQADNNVDNVEVVDIPAPGQNGTYSVIVTRDGTLATSPQVYSLVLSGVGSVNTPPAITPVGPRSVTAGSNLAFAVTASETDGDSVILSASGLPSGAIFNAVTNAGGVTNDFFWSNASPTGTYNVTFRAVDNDGTNTEVVVISVLNPSLIYQATNAAAIIINDNTSASPYPSTISFSNVSGIIRRVAPTLRDFSHTYPSDVDVVLVGPDGSKAGLLGRAGGGTGVTGLSMTFDDGAAFPVGATLTSGTWLPSGLTTNAMPSPAPGSPYPVTLTNFIGKSANGTWSLYVADRAGGDTGRVNNGWSLLVEVEVTSSPPASPTFGMRDDGGVNLPTITYWHDGIAIDATQQGAAFAQNFGQRTNFFIKGASIKTWKNGGDVTGAGVYYKIWNAAVSEPATYTLRSVGFTSNDGGSNQTWASFGSEINVMSGLVPGDYNLKVLFDITGTGTPGILSNGPFTASFTIPEPPVFIPDAPAAIWASETNAQSFVATWAPSAGATNYFLDVGTHPQFEGRDEHVVLIDEDFVDSTGWVSAGTLVNSSVFGAARPSRQIPRNATLTSPPVSVPTQLVFFVDADDNDSGKITTNYFSLNNGASWNVLGTFAVDAAGVTITQSLSEIPVLLNATNVRFRFVSSFNSWYLDDVKVAGLGEFTSKYVAGYSNRSVVSTSQPVTGLVLNATYYMRVRAANRAGVSSNSPMASVTTLEQLLPEPPVFAPIGAQVATTGVTKVFNVFASGRPDPVIELLSTTAVSGYGFNPISGELVYTPTFADVGEQRFVFVASNDAGVATQTVMVTVMPVAPSAPASVWASDVGSTGFVVEWGAVEGAQNYRLDVSASPDFFGLGASVVLHSNNFNAWTTVWLDGWTHNSGSIQDTNGIGGTKCISMNATNDWLRVPAVTNAQSLSFWARTSSDPGNWTVLVQTSSDQLNWTTRYSVVENGAGGDIDNDFRLITVPLNLQGVVFIRFYMSVRSADSIFIDDVAVYGGDFGPSFLPGYSNRTVIITSDPLTGLAENTAYYFRVRAVNSVGVSANSAVGSAMTEPGDPVAPVFVPVPPQTAYVGRAISLNVEATGLPEPLIDLTSATASSGYTFSPDTGRLSYQPPPGDSGMRAFTFVASNSAGTATQTIQVLVTNAPPVPPVVAQIPAQSVLLGSTLNYAVTATDEDGGDQFRFSVNTAVPASTWSFNTNSGAFSFTPGTNQIGTNTFVFRAIDSTSLTSAPVSMVVVVSDQADAVSVSLGSARIVTEEGIATVKIPVNLAFPGTANVRFRFVGPANGTAQRGFDFNCQTQLLISSSSSGNLLVNIDDDDLVEGPESIIVQLIPVSPASAGAVTQAVLYIRDNDSVSILAGNITSGNNQQYEEPGTRILQALAPDIALLQEFETTNGTSPSAYRAWVNSTFGTNFQYVVESGDSIPNGIVSRWPIKAWGEWEDTQVTDRDFVWATIDVPGTQDLHAVSVHLKASSGSDNEAKRTAQARIITNRIAQAGWLNSGLVVVGGDFNLQVRTETALRILTNVVSDLRQSADQNGNRNTNSGRDNPYDLVLPSYNLDARHRSFGAWGYAFPNGMVFDTRITWSSGLPPPALADDSAAFNMQHMAAVKVFELEVTSTSFMQDQVITFPPAASTVTTNIITLSASASSGLPVSYRIASGPGSISSGSNLVFSGAGTVAVVAMQPGNSQWNPAPEVTNQVAVARASQFIDFAAIGPQEVTNVVDLFATATSGLKVRFGVTNGPAQISAEDVLSFSGDGAVRIVAMQDGNALWNPASPLTNTIMVGALVVTNAPVAVPVDWLAENFPGASSNDFSTIVTNLAANGRMSVWETYVAGIDPNNPTSVLAVVASEPPPGPLNTNIHVLRWVSVSGRVYHVGSKTNLFDSFIWTNMPATPPVNSYTTPPADGVFYRIGVSMP